MGTRKLPDTFISVAEAAKLMGVGQATVKTNLQRGCFPVGVAMPGAVHGGRRSKWIYRIPRKAFMTWIETGAIAKGEENGC